MSKGYTLTRSDGTVTTINITKVDRLYDSSVQLSGGAIIKDMAAADIAAIKAIIESYSPGGSSSEWHSDNPLCFTAEQAGSTVTLRSGFEMDPQISYDSETWEDYVAGTVITLANVGDKVYLRGKLYTTTGQTNAFTMTGMIAASGDPESLNEITEGRLFKAAYSCLFYNCTALTTAPELSATELAANCYQYLFYGCLSLTTPPELPATELAGSAYHSMFYGCYALTKAPALPATKLADNCYNSMFYNCTSLTEAPELPATELFSYSYSNMFNGCTALVVAPELPATKLAMNCYSSMFRNCTSLLAAPELPATKLVTNAYYNMFRTCSSLNYIKVGATSWDTTYAPTWVTSVASSGTFVKPADTVIPTGTSGIPSGWTVVNV